MSPWLVCMIAVEVFKLMQPIIGTNRRTSLGLIKISS